MLSWKYPDIPTVYGSNDRPAKFPVLHSQLLIIKNGGHNIEEAMCIYISLAERSLLNELSCFPVRDGCKEELRTFKF